MSQAKVPLPLKCPPPPLIYNLFPTLVGSYELWLVHAARAKSMGFNWVYLNPITLPGMSGSLYSIKDYFLLNPAFLPKAKKADKLSLTAVESKIRQMAYLGVRPMGDLVINHTSIDCPLISQHPSWYCWDTNGKVVHPFAVDPDNPSKKTVWGDLAEINNQDSSDREALWEFWAGIVEAYLDIGFEGFRCDAAYQVPVELWQFLIGRAREINPDVLFLAENLGCTTKQTRALRSAGFQLFCNSSKWWNFEDTWCLDQHHEFEDLSSISFPETHDTDRLAKETRGNEAEQRQRYAFAATFSAGVLIPVGYEFGFQKRLSVVETQPKDWEAPHFDLGKFILAINRLKQTIPLLQGEGALQRLVSPVAEVLILERRSLCAPRERGWIVINKDSKKGHQIPRLLFNGGLKTLYWLRMTMADKNHEFSPCPPYLDMAPSELVLVLERRA